MFERGIVDSDTYQIRSHSKSGIGIHKLSSKENDIQYTSFFG